MACFSFFQGNIVIQSEPAELEWDLEPGLDAVTADAAEGSIQPRQEVETQQCIPLLLYYLPESIVMIFFSKQQ